MLIRLVLPHLSKRLPAHGFPLPLVLDREVDFVTAMLTSLGLVRRNPGVMMVWAALIAMCLVMAMLPIFLGLFLVLPILGHATWHLYRIAISEV